jgi:hypothetical protein
VYLVQVSSHQIWFVLRVFVASEFFVPAASDLLPNLSSGRFSSRQQPDPVLATL